MKKHAFLMVMVFIFLPAMSSQGAAPVPSTYALLDGIWHKIFVEGGPGTTGNVLNG